MFPPECSFLKFGVGKVASSLLIAASWKGEVKGGGINNQNKNAGEVN